MKCYTCDAVATTHEHVPPKGFFPKGYQEKLVTVPSCDTHNHDQSLDIEYVRNVIAGFHGTNAQAEQMFEVVKKSFDRSPALFYQTFGDFETIVVNGEETAKFTFDLERVKSVMRAIANAIYFKDYGESYDGLWNVFVTSLKSWEDFAGEPNQWEPFRNLLATIQFAEKPVPQPAIFMYAVHEMPDGFVFKFVFYGAFTIHCFGPKLRAARPSKPGFQPTAAKDTAAGDAQS